MLSAQKWRKDYQSDHHVIKNTCYQILKTVFKSFCPVGFSISGVLYSVMLPAQFHNGPLVSCSPAVQQWTLGSIWVCTVAMCLLILHCHNALLGSTRPWCVTTGPWFQELPLCHQGLLDLHYHNGQLVTSSPTVSQRKFGSMGAQSVTMDPWFHELP